jgi:iron(III) transport system permease protein
LGLLWAWIAVPFLPIYGTLWILLICYVTIFVPYGVRSISAAMMQIDPSLEECAVVCGATWGRVMRTIVLPILRPSLMAAWTLIFVSIVKELSASALLYKRQDDRALGCGLRSVDQFLVHARVAALALIEAFIIFVVLWLARSADPLGSRCVIGSRTMLPKRSTSSICPSSMQTARRWWMAFLSIWTKEST